MFCHNIYNLHTKLEKESNISEACLFLFDSLDGRRYIYDGDKNSL